MTVPLIEAMNLSKIYGPSFSPGGLIKRVFSAGISAVAGDSRTKAVENLSFAVPQGGVCGFLGPNGAGKTTTLKMLAGLLIPTTGEVRLFGKDFRKDWFSVFSRTGGLIDKPNLYEFLSGRVNLQLKAYLYNCKNSDNFDEILDMFSLSDAADRKVSTYSTGMKQRLAIAAAMVHEPELLFLDEPSRGLDPKGQAEIRQILLKIKEKGNTTIFISSHMLHEVEQVCDNVVIIDKGEHLFSGSISDLGGKEVRIKLVTSQKEKTEKVLTESELVETFESLQLGRECSFELVMKSGNSAHIGRLMVENKIDIVEISPLRNSLEEFFLKVTSRKGDENGTH
jgi:ABC-2 type transport system ATP-binding protein